MLDHARTKIAPAKIRRAYFVHDQPIKAIWCLSEGRTEGHPVGGGRVSLRTRGAAPSEDRALERQA